MARYCPYCTSPIQDAEECPYCEDRNTYKAKPHHLMPGTLLNRKYLVGKVIGEGGFGITYLARDLILDLKVSIKEYYPSDKVSRDGVTSSYISESDASFSESFNAGKAGFIQEAQTLAKLDGEKAVVTVREWFEANNTAYIVMEYVDGKTLREIVEENGRIKVGELMDLFEPIFDSLGRIHKTGLVHRDISPNNIMLEDGALRLIDFGGTGDSNTYESFSPRVITRGYSSPEQYVGEQTNNRSDIYSLAATIYYCLTGVNPPEASERVGKDVLENPNAKGAELSLTQQAALLKALSLDKNKRFDSVEGFKTSFYKGRDGKKPAIMRAAVAAALVLSVVCIGIGIASLNNPGRSVTTNSVSYVGLADKVPNNEREKLESISNAASFVLETDTSGRAFSFVANNNTEYDLSGATAVLQLYNTAGELVMTQYNTLNGWNSGKSVEFECNVDDAVSGNVQVMYADATDSSKYYRSENIAVQFVENSIEMKTAKEFPYSVENIYTMDGATATATAHTITGFDYEIKGNQLAVKLYGYRTYVASNTFINDLLRCYIYTESGKEVYNREFWVNELDNYYDPYAYTLYITPQIPLKELYGETLLIVITDKQMDYGQSEYRSEIYV